VERQFNYRKCTQLHTNLHLLCGLTLYFGKVTEATQVDQAAQITLNCCNSRSTCINLADRIFPMAKQLETCESVNSITAILQEQARSFREFRESDGKLMKALNSSVDVLCSPSISSALSETIGLVVRQKAFIGLPCS
jgi:hypothetical protein